MLLLAPLLMAEMLLVRMLLLSLLLGLLLLTQPHQLLFHRLHLPTKPKAELALLFVLLTAYVFAIGL